MKMQPEAVKEKINYDKLNCDGCGVKIQMDEPSSLGYLPKEKIDMHFQKRKKQEEFKIEIEQDK